MNPRNAIKISRGSLDRRFTPAHHPPEPLLMRCAEIIQRRDVI